MKRCKIVFSNRSQILDNNETLQKAKAAELAASIARKALEAEEERTRRTDEQEPNVSVKVLLFKLSLCC